MRTLILVVVGGDTKRVQWITHHVTSRWPSAQVTTLRAGESATLSRLIAEGTPDAVMLQAWNLPTRRSPTMSSRR